MGDKRVRIPVNVIDAIRLERCSVSLRDRSNALADAQRTAGFLLEPILENNGINFEDLRGPFRISLEEDSAFLNLYVEDTEDAEEAAEEAAEEPPK